MVKTGKFYVHAEDIDPNMTLPFALDPGLTFTEVADKFCQKYNAKNGANLQVDSANVEFKVGSKLADLGDVVSDLVSAGDDVFILCSKATRAGAPAEASTTPSSGSGANVAASASPVPAHPAAPAVPVSTRTGTPVGKKLKVYLHYEGGTEKGKDQSRFEPSKDSTATQAFPIEFKETTVGELIKEFVDGYNAKALYGKDKKQLDLFSLCARNDASAILPVDATIAQSCSNGDDIWIVPLSVAMKEDNSTVSKEDLPSDANGVQRSNLRAKDKSYYYWAHKPVGETPAPREAPRQIRKREATKDEKVQYQTIAKYAFDSEGGYVSVYITLPGIQELPASSFEFEAEERSMSLRIMGYQGFNHRLQVPKLSEFIDPKKSTYKVKKDMVLLKLCKIKKDHHWYELHKTKGIGETEET